MKIEAIPLEAPQALRDMAEMVNRATLEEAEAQQRGGIEPAEAMHRALRSTAAARAEVGKMFAEWAKYQVPRVIVRPE
jgi:hypothetical protein